MASLTENN